MSTHRRIALTAGLLYLATFVTSFPGLALKAVATVPVALWELSLGVWLVVRGFAPGTSPDDL